MEKPEALSSIPEQARLPLATAVRIVTRGIRLRLGRSLVTLLGVTLGIAFLMATLTGEALRRGVADEDARRDATTRAYDRLVCELGPLHGKRVALFVRSPPTDAERRLLARIAEDAPREVTSAPGAPALSTFLRLSTASAEDQARLDADRRRERTRLRFIVAISLLVTVIGIANSMLMSVTERFRDIGTMKCLGALSSLVRTLFILEAAFMGVSGGVLGVTAGVLFALASYALPYGALVLGAFGASGGTLVLDALLCVVAALLLSMLAALYPASLAARMVPADALRSSV